MSIKKKSTSTAFRCRECSYTQPRWLGRCPECGQWNTFEEIVLSDDMAAHSIALSPNVQKKAKPVPLATVNPMEGTRVSSGIPELDRVLGNGIMKRSAILVGGEPGIGKSTLLLQMATKIGCSTNASKGRVLYVSGEESAGQIRMRSDRLGLNASSVEILCTSRLEDIESALNDLQPVCVIIDSIQTIYSPEGGVIPGTINQLKYCAHELVSWVKERDSVLFLVAHVTKEGSIAGPKALEHMVDTVLSFEKNDENVRFIRAQKNRFGSVDEIGIFAMSETGLLPVEDPGSLFIVQRNGELPPGVAVVPVFEGSRVFLVEIQALTVPAKSALSRVLSDTIESARVSRVAAVLEKRLGLRSSDQDLYVNLAGGIRLTEPAVDIALAAALYSARTDIALPKTVALVGELSLAGEIRPVPRLKQRAKAVIGLGLSVLYSPESEENCKAIKNIQDLIANLFSSRTTTPKD